MGDRLPLFRRTGLHLLLVGAALAGPGCGGEPVDPSSPGTLRVTVATTGEFLPRGYEIIVNSIGPGHPVGLNEVVELTDMRPDNYSIFLGPLPINCVIAGGDRRDVTIVAGRVSKAAYAVSCVMPDSFSTVLVRTTSVGPGNDPDGYLFRIDDGEWQPIGPYDAVAVRGLPPGVHTVFLGGLASHCAPMAVDHQDVTVDASLYVNADFTIYCTHNPPSQPSGRTAATGR